MGWNLWQPTRSLHQRCQTSFAQILFPNDLPNYFHKEIPLQQFSTSSQKYIMNTFKFLSGHGLFILRNGPCPQPLLKHYTKATLSFRKQRILKNFLLILENLFTPLSIHRTFTQPCFFSLILSPHRKATSFFVLLICFNQIAQWYKTQNKGRWVLLVYSGCVLEQFGFLLSFLPLGFCVQHSLLLAHQCPRCTTPHKPRQGTDFAPRTLPPSHCKVLDGVFRQTDLEQNSFLWSKLKSMSFP